MVEQPRQISLAGIPLAEVEVDVDLVRRLLQAQHPDLADQRLTLIGSGWDNTTYRLGETLAIRLPRRQLAVELILKEQTWLPAIADLLPGLVPVPVRVGHPGPGYPWPWSIVPWVAGSDAVASPLPLSQAESLGLVIRNLHQPAPPTAPRNPFSGVPLVSREPSVSTRLARMDFAGIDASPAAVVAAWTEALAVPVDTADVWIHGDLHPRNLIVSEGRLAAIVDWGDLCVGDPATDLAAAWLVFEDGGVAAFFRGYGPASEATWERARGWAIVFAVLLIDSGDGEDETWADVGRRTLGRVCG